MADISKINGYDLKDNVARQGVTDNANNINDLEYDVNAANSRITKVNEKIDTEITAVSARIDALDDRTNVIGNMQSDITTLNNKVDTTNAALLDTNARVDDLASLENDLTTLTQRVDSFASLPEGSTAGNAELLDIRVGADGITYDTAGNAVRRQIRKINEYSAGYVFYHTYNLKSYEQSNGFYDSTGKFVQSTTFKSYMVPVKKTDRFLFCNVNTTITAFTAAKEFIAEVPRQKITRAITNLSTVAESYRYDTIGIEGIYYVSVPYGSGMEYLRSGSNDVAVPVFPIAADSTAEEIEVIALNGRVVNCEQLAIPRNWKENEIMNVSTGLTGPLNGYYNIPFAFFRAGTKITSKYSNVVFNLRGMTVNQNIIITGLQEYTFNFDFFGALDYYLVNWYWGEFAPQNMTQLEESYFLRIVTPEETAYNRWYGKTWYSYGTSLTDIGANDTNGNNGHSGKWPLYLDAVSGMVRHNGAIGSGGIRTSAGHGGNVLNAILQTPYNVDLVTLETLPNDGYANPTYVGDITDTGTTTICGAFKAACDYITKNTRAKMVVIFVTGDTSSNDPMGTDHAAYIAAKEKLITIADMYGVTVIDAEKDCINWAKRKQGITYKDNIHLNYLGGEIYGRYIWERIKEIDNYPEFQDV